MKDIQYKFVINKDHNNLELKASEPTEEHVEKDNSYAEFKKINIDDFEGEHKCPRCGFEWND